MNNKQNEQQKERKFNIPTILGIIFCVILIPILISNLILIIKGYTNPGEISSCTTFIVFPMC